MLQFFPLNSSQHRIKANFHPSFNDVIDSQSCNNNLYYLNSTNTLFSATFTPSRILERQKIIAYDVKEFTVQ